MKVMILLAFVGIGVILAFSNSGTDAQQQPGWEQGMNRADTYLQGVFTPEVSLTFQEKAHASADWLDGLKERVKEAAD